nr:MAG TPA: Nuclease [Caudoviricetes sp.]
MYNRLKCEATEQEAVIQWSHYHMNRWPELDLLFHIPNGGSRNKAEAARLKAQGVKAGVCDLFLPVARGRYHGLFIEMKYGKNTATPAQKNFISAVTAQGYLARVAYSFEEATTILEQYLAAAKS